LNNNGIEYYDGTNKSILKFQKEIENKYEDGYETALVGIYNDIDLINLNSYYNIGIFINKEEEFVKLSNNNKKYIICSANNDKKAFNNICKEIENNYNIESEKYIIKNEFDLLLKNSIKVSKKSDLRFIVRDNKEDVTTLKRN